MKRKWLNIIIIITILLLIGSAATSVVIPSTKNHEKNEDILYPIKSDYFNDWYINNNYSEEYGCGGDDFNKGKCEDNISGDIWNNQITSDIVSGPMDSAWSMRGHDVNHTCRSPYSTENNTGTEIWQVRGDEEGTVESSAVINSDGIIYFGTMASDTSLYALYPNGTRKWRYNADGLIWCTPAIADDGTLYFTTWGAYHYFYALTPNGTAKWLFAPALGSGSTSSPAIGEDGTIYFGDDAHIIYALNPNGTQKWRYITSDIVMGSPAIGQDGTIYIGSGDYYLYALYPNGTLRWRFNTGSKIKGDASIGEDGTIYVPAFNSYFYALYPDGTLKWKGYTGSSIAGAGVALAEDGTIYIGTELLRAYYPNGTLKWSTDVEGDLYGTVPAVSADGTIYVSAGGSLVAVNPDGTERWRKQLTIAQIRSSPSIGSDDRVYVGSEDYGLSAYGYLYAFGPFDPNIPTTPTITGQTNGKIDRTYEYTFTSTSPLGNQLYYRIEWGDGATTDWLGPYNSSETITMSHSWSEKGTYTIKARAKDTDNRWGPWGNLTVTMPTSFQIPFMQFWVRVLEQFPHAFPILRYLLTF
jgi:outer membrane protein assembly factor BamB